MKKFMLPLIIGLSLVSCTDGKTSQQTHDEENETGKKISTRDLSITQTNSYSNLFLDSAALAGFLTREKIPAKIARRMRSFYNTRNYQFAWFSDDGLTEQARGFWNLHDYVTAYGVDSSLKDKKLQNTMDELVTEENLSVTASNKTYVHTELKLTQHFIQYMLNNYEKGYVKRKEMERFIPFKKQDPLTLADSLINKKHKDDKYFEDVNAAYRGLKNELVKYYEFTKKGGWPPLNFPKTLPQKNQSAPGITALKQQLQLTGDMPPGDTSQLFDNNLANALSHYQERLGLKPTGTLTAATIKELNVPAHTRLEQILMNMDRMRWTPADPVGNLIVVNIPEFKLHLFEGPKQAFEMVVVVGKEGHNTMMFNGELNQIVFSPYWNVPPSIVRNEILPAMERNPDYLASQDMEIVNTDGDLPVIRQRPGPKNALGKVKFLFPNSFNIYFHDTPSKSLFEKDKRAFSHGCIRLKEPEKMATYLLRDQPEWTPEKIREAMNSGTEKFVRLTQPIPVIITYYTAWVSRNGKLNFREDIYDHDKKLAAKMFLR